MRPPEHEVCRIVAEWIRKADLDFDTVARLVAEERFRNIVAFHSQQAAEKYLKALLTRHQVEFPKTRALRHLLKLLHAVESDAATALEVAAWLNPFGVDVRYPGDFPETVPGDKVRALELARLVRVTVMAILDPYLGVYAGDRS